MNQQAPHIPVKCTITSYFIDQDEEQTQQTEGTVLYKNGSYYVRYEEQTEDQERVQNTLKITGHTCKVIRHGAVRMNHRYEQGKTTEGTYETPFGLFHMKTRTTDVHFSPVEQEGYLDLRYHLALNDQTVGRFRLYIDFTQQFPGRRL